jgi:hypothetical protein
MQKVLYESVKYRIIITYIIKSMLPDAEFFNELILKNLHELNLFILPKPP